MTLDRSTKLLTADGRLLPNLEVITGTDRAANTEITETVPAAEVWEVVAVRFQLVTDANVATRRVALSITDGSTTFLEVTSEQTHVASLTRDYDFASWGVADALAEANIKVNAPFPVTLRPGYVISTTTDNIQVGDNYGAPAIFAVRWT